MVIQIDGGSSNNKGAQLMQYACLVEIKEKFPNAIVYINDNDSDPCSLSNKFGLNIKKRQSNLWRLIVAKTRIGILFNKYLPYFSWLFSLKVPARGVDVLLNIGGFQFGDQWNHNNISNKDWERYLSKMRKYGTRIIFMPQAFGPFEKKGSQEIARILDKYTDMVLVRDSISMEYIKLIGVCHPIIELYPDFTYSVKGTVIKHNVYKRGVCFIPNSKMITQKVISEEDYLKAMATMIIHVNNKGERPFLLNHEGKGDLLLCEKIKNMLGIAIDIVDAKDAVMAKSIISDSILVISSRFHGVANSLNSAVPCLATSWSHKYQMLFKDYGCNDNILDINDIPNIITKVDKYLDAQFNQEEREKLLNSVDVIKKANEQMWQKIWNFK